MSTLFKNTQVEIYVKSQKDGIYGLIITDSRLAWQINQILERYPKRTKFESWEEPTFKCPLAQIKIIGSRIRVIAKILAQMCPPLPTLGGYEKATDSGHKNLSGKAG